MLCTHNPSRPFCFWLHSGDKYVHKGADCWRRSRWDFRHFQRASLKGQWKPKKQVHKLRKIWYFVFYCINTFCKRPFLDTASQILVKRFLFEMYRMIAVIRHFAIVINIWPKLLNFWNINNFAAIPLAFVRVASLTYKICRTQISCSKGNGTGFWFIHYRLMTANFGVAYCATQLVKTIATTQKTQA